MTDHLSQTESGSPHLETLKTWAEARGLLGGVPMMGTGGSPELWRDAYEFVDEPAEFVSGDSCSRCGGVVESWTESVPCCGPPYTCEDTIYCFACHNCKVMGDRF